MNSSFRKIFIDLPKFIVINLYETIQFIYVSFKISRVSYPRVTFFGGAHLPEINPYINKAYLLAKRLAERDIAVVTGGGPGIMESVNKGATEIGKKVNKIMSFGINVKNIPGEKGENVYAQVNVILNNYFMRKWILINNSKAFVIFPGGFGTMDELSTVLTLIQIKRLKKVPVILFGKDFWQPFMNWVYESALVYGTIKKEEAEFIKVTDDIEEAYCLLIDHCSQFQ